MHVLDAIPRTPTGKVQRKRVGASALQDAGVKFAVLGAGAIGAYVGAALARGGSDVTLIARGEHLRAMQAATASRCSARAATSTRIPAATDDLDAIADADVVFIGLKAHSLPALAPRLGAALAPGAAVIAAQNGLPWWYFQSHGGPLEGTVLESVDPGGAIARCDPAGSRGRLRRSTARPRSSSPG